MDENFKSNEPVQGSAAPAQESQQPECSSGSPQQPDKKAWSGKKVSTVIISAVAIFAIGFAGGITANAVVQTGRDISAKVLERSGISRGHDWDGRQPQADANDRGEESGSHDESRSKDGLDFSDDQQDGGTAPDTEEDQIQGSDGLFGPDSRRETEEGQDDSGPRQDKNQDRNSLDFGDSRSNGRGRLFQEG